MKYLYPYECEKRGLSSPVELQAAIDSNRREGRRQSYGSTIFNYSPVGTPTLLSSPKIQMSHLSMPTHNSGHISQVPVIKKGNIRQHKVQYKTQIFKTWLNEYHKVSNIILLLFASTAERSILGHILAPWSAPVLTCCWCKLSTSSMFPCCL